jgi:hypothetical protein
MAIKKIFKSTVPSISYIARDGMQCAFIGGKHITDIDSHIAELTAESKSPANPYIYIDEAEAEIDTEALSPLEIIKAEAYAQAKADILRAMDANKDGGNYLTPDFNKSLGNSNTIAQGGEAGSNGDAEAPAAPATTDASGNSTPGPVTTVQATVTGTGPISASLNAKLAALKSTL